MGAKESKPFSGVVLGTTTTPFASVGQFFVYPNSTTASTLIAVYNLSSTFLGYLTVPQYQISATTASSPVQSSSITQISPDNYGRLFKTLTTFFLLDASIVSPSTSGQEITVRIRLTPSTTSEDPIELSDVLLVQEIVFQGDQTSVNLTMAFAYYDENRECVTYKDAVVRVYLDKSPNQLSRLLATSTTDLSVTMTHSNGPGIYPVFNSNNPRNLVNCLGVFSFTFASGPVTFTRSSRAPTTPCSPQSFSS